jgi:hypothetical protein
MWLCVHGVLLWGRGALWPAPCPAARQLARWEGLASQLMVVGGGVCGVRLPFSHRCAIAQARRVVTCASRVVQKALLLASPACSISHNRHHSHAACYPGTHPKNSPMTLLLSALSCCVVLCVQVPAAPTLS